MHPVNPSLPPPPSIPDRSTRRSTSASPGHPLHHPPSSCNNPPTSRHELAAQAAQAPQAPQPWPLFTTSTLRSRPIGSRGRGGRTVGRRCCGTKMQDSGRLPRAPVLSLEKALVRRKKNAELFIWLGAEMRARFSDRPMTTRPINNYQLYRSPLRYSTLISCFQLQ
jgi:hypothetical protein